jgi:hypothetical protein
MKADYCTSGHRAGDACPKHPPRLDLWEGAFSDSENFFSAAENLLTDSVTVFCDLETGQFLLREPVLSVKAGRYGYREFVYSLNKWHCSKNFPHGKCPQCKGGY